ncbi:disease resistance protein At4g27190-like [Rhodamnia argentea]|uniref:Disease resistance protein At4g27190-like n=1 Tax=Rhodamnia argentea TaxID=178133 RepID=A0ABM3HGL1_9MYRT|nr:disease resistance protein At4g27190-like [Rhodamnia argentea]
MTDDIKNLILANSNKEISFSGPARREGNDATASVLSTSMSVKLRDHGVFESRASMIRNIMDALADNSKSVVGVYGMGGVGKSTLLEDVKRILIEERSFDWVAKADVSKNPNIHTIQGDIAACLKLTDIKKEETISARAELLRERLEKEGREKKKVLIILDNLWEKLDLKLVGIPCGHDNKAIGCKLLLTSRDQRLLQREMGCDREFLLGGLDKEEARALFERTVGDKVHDNEFQPWVEAALRRCAGVPFLIVAMGKLLKYAALYEWRDTLKKIEKFNHREINGLIDQMLQWSYDRLEGEAKSLLRLCVVYSVSKPSLENLVRYGFGLGLFQQVSSMEEARDRLHTQIRALQASALLLDSEDIGGFKIHDLVCEFVALVSSRDHHPLLVLEDPVKSLTELPEDKLESCEAMCFPNMKELSQELNCPELRILLLSTKDDSLHIPDSYFNSMRNLMVLNLTSIRLTCSPSPFQFLSNLHTLCFQNCSFEDVAILGNLKGLHILSIVDSEIQRLPKEIGQLVELRSLDLSRCPKLEIIEPGVLQSLTNLEELYLKQSFHHWSAGEQTQPTNASLSELNHMKKLCTLHVSIPDPRVLPDDLYVEKLTKYEIRIGKEWRWWKDCNGSRTLELINLEKIYHNHISIKSFKTLKVVRVEGCDKMEVLFPCSVVRQLPHLEKIEVVDCELMRGIVEADDDRGKLELPKLRVLKLCGLPNIASFFSTGSSPSRSTSDDQVGTQIAFFNGQQVSFPFLESLTIEGLPNLNEIWSDESPLESSNLRSLKVVQCESLSKVISSKSLVKLHKLQTLRINDCSLVQEIFYLEGPSANGDVETLSELTTLELNKLGSLRHIWQENPSGIVSFHKLKEFKLDGCDNLEFIFFPSMVKSLAQPRDLTVANCKKMETIIAEEEGLGMEISKTLTFSMLTNLLLRRLESLKCFSRRKCKISFFCFITKDFRVDRFILEIQMMTFFSSNDKPMTGSREAQSRDRVNSHSAALFGGEVAFPSLAILEVSGLGNPEFLFSPSMVKSLAKLRNLTVSDCKKMEAIITEEEGLGVEISETLSFPMLTNLRLTNLGGLTCFSSEKGWLKSLESLKAKACVSLEVVLELQPLIPLDGQPVALPLKEATVSGLPKLKDLTQLEELEIRECGIAELIEKEGVPVPRILTEVISDKGSKEGHEVAFHHLKCMELDGLIELKCFSSGGCALIFPLLEDVIVNGCPNMKFFFEGPIEAPKLDSPTAAKAKFVRLFEFPELVGKWHNEHNPVNSSWQLKTLVVDKCPSFINAMPFKLMLVLEKMTSLQVRDCKSLEEIFDLEGLESVESTRVLPRLEDLHLINLPKLRQLWNKDLQGMMRFNSLSFLSSLTLYKL